MTLFSSAGEEDFFFTVSGFITGKSYHEVTTSHGMEASKMIRELTMTVLGSIVLLAAPLAYAKKEMPPHTGGVSPQHMSQSGQSNTNSPAMGQEKAGIRADDRKSDQGLMHDNDGKKAPKGKAKGHNK